MIEKSYNRISLTVKDAGDNVVVPANTSPIKKFLGEPVAVGCTVVDGVVSGFDHDARLLVVAGVRSPDLSPTRVVIKVNDENVGYSEGANGQPIVALVDVQKGDSLGIYADNADTDALLSANPLHSYLNIHELDA